MLSSLPFPADVERADVPAAGVAPEHGYVELIAESLREVCDRPDDAALAVIARVIDQHLAGSLQSRRVGRWRNEALDDLLTLISPAMQARIRQRGRTRRGAAA